MFSRAFSAEYPLKKCMEGLFQRLPNRKYVRTDLATEIFTTNANGVFVFGNLTNSMGGPGSTWTELSADWTTNSNNCSDWTSSAAGAGIRAFGNSTTAQAIEANTAGCSSSFKIYCVEQ